MPFEEPKNVCEIVDSVQVDKFSQTISEYPRGITIIPELIPQLDGLALKSDAAHFYKWTKINNPDLEIQYSNKSQLLSLHSDEIWLPLVFLASNVSLPIYLNLVSNYIYDRIKGALKTDKHLIHISAECEDKNTGKIKRFNFTGDHEALRQAITKFNINEFYNE